MAPSKSKSFVWRYFYRPEKNNFTAKCESCGKLLKTSGNTTNLVAHLKQKHPIIYSRETEARSSTPKNSTEDESASKKQRLQLDFFQGTSSERETILGEEEIDDVSAIGSIRNFIDVQSVSCSEGISNTLPKEKATANSQATVSGMFKLASSFADGGSQNIKITNAIAEYICIDNQPFSTVEGRGFLKLMRTICPKYKVPARNSIKTVIDRKFETVSTVFKNILNSTKHVSLTTDIWSDHQMRSFLGLTVHFIKNQKLTSCCLGVTQLIESHTATYITEQLGYLLDQWEIPLEKIIGVVTDNAANMVKAMNETFGGDHHVPCFAHTINLICEKSFKKSEGLGDLIRKVRSIVIWVKNSTRASDELRNFYLRDGIPEGKIKKLILDVKTRWNSTFYMLRRFVELLPSVRHVVFSLIESPTMIYAAEIKMVNEIIKVLEPIEKITVEFSGEKYTTLSKVIPVVQCLLSFYSSLDVVSMVGAALKENILLEIKNRFAETEQKFLMASATLLDPRFKNIHFKDSIASIALYENVRAAIKPNQLDDSSDSDTTMVEPEPVLDLWTHHKNVVNETKKQESEDELGLFLERPVASLSQDPILVWEELRHIYPNLYNLAAKYFTVPATSVPCERLFSKAGATASLARNRLNPKRLSKLIFLNSMPEEYWI